MGAFFLRHKDSIISESSIDKLYRKKGFESPFNYQLGDYYLKLFRKQLLNIDNHLQIGSNHIFASGSLFYKGFSYNASLRVLLSDFINNKIDSQNLYGNYVILFYNSKNLIINIFIDPSFTKTVYYDTKNKIISTDFLAFLNALPTAYTLNSKAFIENITTGYLISPDTYANEIKKIDKINYLEIEKKISGIKVISIKPEITKQIEDRNEAIIHANSVLSEYFKNSRNLAEEFGTHIGLTGGFDSRLLLMHARKHIKNLITNSFWRPDSIEYKNAKKLAESAAIKFISFENSRFTEKDNDELLREAYYFFDGQIRSQNNWDEVFNMAEYATKLASNHFVGFHGCGGEQYRNADRLSGHISLKNYILHDWMFKQCQNIFLDNNLKKDIYENILRKIRRLTGISNNRISLFELKKIQNEIWNTSNRTTRVNLLNQLQFYFAPFTEYQLSRAAYLYVPYLGRSLSFQVDMMSRLDPSLASVMTNYGYSIIDGEPFKNKAIPYIVNILPRSFINNLHFKLKKTQTNKFNLEEFKNYSDPFFHTLENKIDLDVLSKNKNLGNSLRSFDILLKKSCLSHNKITLQ